MAHYRNETDYAHASSARLGVLLTNLGTPDAPTTKALRRYLGEFLSDPRVIEIPRPIWWLVLHGVILRLRPRRAAHAYRSIWTADGSPLRVIGERQASSLQTALQRMWPERVEVALGMRYGHPSIAAAMEKLRQAHMRRLLVLPLYPQYSATTTASTFDAVAEVLNTWRWLPDLRMVTHYHDDAGYIAAVADSLRAYWKLHGPCERLLMSFHGLPKRNLLAGDPYHCQCHATARLIAKTLELADDRWQLAFQSRFGRAEWLRPYTDKTLAEWGAAGIKKVDVICPGFPADCLETLEEIALQNRRIFLANGGEQYRYVPALNDSAEHILALAHLVLKHTQGWPEVSSAPALQHMAEVAAASRARALAAGATR